ncbi:MAG: hypothetical protein GEV06_00620 [Luteitalea sp.]|nr:hypothetical protein [Luteitalea sp.]
MNADDLRRFARRDWLAAAHHKIEYWVEQYRQHGPAPARTASTALLLHMRAVQPDYPSASDRAGDLANHLQLRDRLDRATRALAGR